MTTDQDQRINEIRARDGKLFPIQDSRSIPWALAERAYDTYVRLYGRSQSLERLAQRGGFGLEEFACLFAGHRPHKDAQACVEKADTVGRYIASLEAERDYLQASLTELRNLRDGWLALLNPTCSEETVEGAIRNLQQAYSSERDNATALEAELKEAREKASALTGARGTKEGRGSNE